MKFSDRFKIKRRKNENWFDPILTVDTLLFVDPFLVYANEYGPFKGSYKEIIDFFNSVFRLIARSGGDEQSQAYKKTVRVLVFPEREEICLGYTRAGTTGSGSGRDLAKRVVSAIWEAIEVGMYEITHFEEITLLREGIGAV